jgi:hypothetical protein
MRECMRWLGGFMMASSQIAVALTHLFKGTPRVAPSRKRALRHTRVVLHSEHERRLAIVEQLYRLHDKLAVRSRAAASEAFASPPDSWLNAQLASLGESWRVQSVDGFRYEIYDAP